MLYLLSNSSRTRLILVFILVYVGAAIAFAVFYAIIDGSTARGAGDILYFSLVTQSTIGFGDFLPQNSAGRYAVVVQSGFALVWIALVPAGMVVRLFSPSPNSFLLDPVAVFDPWRRTFVFRYANRSKVSAVNTRFAIRLRRTVEDRVAVNVRNFVVRLAPRTIENAENLVPILLRTERSADGPFSEPTVDDFELTLRPGHFRRSAGREEEQPLVRVTCTYETPYASAGVLQEYSVDDIRCGSFRGVETSRGQYDWNNIGITVPIGSTDEGCTFCLKSCEFRMECQFADKVPEPE